MFMSPEPEVKDVSRILSDNLNMFITAVWEK